MSLAPTHVAADIDSALRRLERAGGLRLAIDDGGVSPALVKAVQRRAHALRAEAQRRALNSLVTGLLRLPRALFAARRRFEAEPTVSTVG